MRIKTTLYLLSSDSQSDGLCGVRNRANQPWMKTSTCRTAHTWKNMIRGSWLDVSLFSHVGKAIRDIWLVYIGLRTKIYSAAFHCVNLSMYIIKNNNRYDGIVPHGKEKRQKWKSSRPALLLYLSLSCGLTSIGAVVWIARRGSRHNMPFT